MDILKRINFVLCEEEYKYSSTQINMPEDIASQVHEYCNKIPENNLSEDGHEDKPHVTVKYGLIDPDAEKLKELLKDKGPVVMTMGKISIFKADEKRDSDVVKVEIESKDLVELNKLICDHFEHITTYEYTPHMTIAYVKPGCGADYDGDDYFDGTIIASDILLLSDKSGNKIEIPLR